MKPKKTEYDDTFNFTSPFEGWSDSVYLNKNDVRTIGYGTTNLKYVNKGKITKEEGRRAMIEDLEANEDLLRQNVKDYDYLPDSAKIVLRDILYNVGQGNLFKKSPKFIKALNTGDWESAAALMDWDNNKPGMGGARKRNAARQQLFLSDLGKRVIGRVPQTTEMLSTAPQYQAPTVKIPVDRTDYSLTNTPLLNPATGMANAWYGANTPSYGGSDMRLPTFEQFLNSMATIQPWAR